MPRRSPYAPVQRGPKRWEPGAPLAKYVTREDAALVISHELFPVTRKVVERWPIKVHYLGGKGLVELAEVRRHAEWLAERSGEIAMPSPRARATAKQAPFGAG